MKKIPQRMCVGCRSMKPKSELFRVVKTPDGTVVFDETNKQPGRGAYICKNIECFNKTIKTKALARALKTAIPDDVRESVCNILK